MGALLGQLPMCMRSSVHPCSQSRAPVGTVYACWCPASEVNADSPNLRHPHLHYHYHSTTITSAASTDMRSTGRELSHLECQVLQEVRGSVGGIGLRPTSGIDEHPDSGGLRIR